MSRLAASASTVAGLASTLAAFEALIQALLVALVMTGVPGGNSMRMAMSAVFPACSTWASVNVTSRPDTAGVPRILPEKGSGWTSSASAGSVATIRASRQATVEHEYLRKNVKVCPGSAAVGLAVWVSLSSAPATWPAADPLAMVVEPATMAQTAIDRPSRPPLCVLPATVAPPDGHRLAGSLPLGDQARARIFVTPTGPARVRLGTGCWRRARAATLNENRWLLQTTIRDDAPLLSALPFQSRIEPA